MKLVKFSFSRQKEIFKLKNQLDQNGFPRIQMLILILLTSTIALLSSFILLKLNFTSMPIRYFFVSIIAYSFFLFLLWLWIRTKIEDIPNLVENLEIPEVELTIPEVSIETGGGEFGGAGSSSSFDTIGSSMDSILQSENPVVEALSSSAEAEEFAVPLIILILVLTLVFSSIFVIYTAPSLFAELLFDFFLSAGLYKNLKDIEPQNWFLTSIKKTILPFAIISISSIAGGFILQLITPEANTIGDFLFKFFLKKDTFNF